MLRYHRAVSRRRPGERLSSARLYLRSLADDALSARHSSGARTRTAHLLGFLSPLQEAAAAALDPQGEVSLLVVNSRDWQLVCSYPYGLPFTRSLPGTSVVIAAADYPERLKKRFDDLLLAAGKAGAAPGPVSEFLDLLVGHEWGHAVANRSGLRTGVKWLDELMATYLLVAGLLATGGAEGHALLERWTRVQVAATADLRGALDEFEYPRGRMQLAKLLWFQGTFTQRALELAEARGWELAVALRAALARDEGAPAPHRGDVARALVEVEPSFRRWFAVFGEPQPSVDVAGASLS
jgi:hypothetical protein